VATTLIICTGASVVVFSALPPVATFGTLIVLTLLVALVGDLIVLPSLLRVGAPFFKTLGNKSK
jgi:predicted RND superfamily exporter protein